MRRALLVLTASLLSLSGCRDKASETGAADAPASTPSSHGAIAADIAVPVSKETQFTSIPRASSYIPVAFAY